MTWFSLGPIIPPHNKISNMEIYTKRTHQSKGIFYYWLALATNLAEIVGSLDHMDGFFFLSWVLLNLKKKKAESSLPSQPKLNLVFPTLEGGYSLLNPKKHAEHGAAFFLSPNSQP